MIAAEPKAPAERRQQLLPIGQLAFASCTSEEQLEVMEAAFEQRERLPVGTARAAVGLLKAIAKEARTCSCPLAATARRNICYAQLLRGRQQPQAARPKGLPANGAEQAS